jgi:chitosanase
MSANNEEPVSEKKQKKELQKRVAQAIVNIFETGKAQGEYGQVTLLAGDSGHLTYGRAQTTLGSGNLFLLIKDYCEAEGAQFAEELHPFLERLLRRDTSLDRDTSFRSLLRQAGDDPVMHNTQDRFFDRVYWNPAVNACGTDITTALGTAVVYDSHIHGSWVRMRDRTNANHGTVQRLGEKSWVGEYVETRRAWLANHPNTLLRKTIYRMDTFRNLIAQGKWDLSLPLHVRGVRIDEEALGFTPVRVSAQDIEERLLMLRTPLMQGEDVRRLQDALAAQKIKVSVDGIFGPGTDKAVRQYQRTKKLKEDGIVGPAVRAALCI